MVQSIEFRVRRPSIINCLSKSVPRPQQHLPRVKNREINSIGLQQWSNKNERALQLLSRIKRETFMLVLFPHPVFRVFDKLLRYLLAFAAWNWFLRFLQWTLSCLASIETSCSVLSTHKFIWLLQRNSLWFDCNKYFTLRFNKFNSLSKTLRQHHKCACKYLRD